jgi:hypothetical protein
MRKQKTQPANARKDATIFSFWPNRLAPETKGLLYNGLERVVNVGDSLSEYLELAKMCESFWPLDTQDADAGLIRWDPAAHGVFLVFRNYLRRIWVSDRESLENGHLDVLLGLNLAFADHPELEYWSPQNRTLHESWAGLRDSYQKIGVGIRPVVAPTWGTGTFSYTPINDFQRAIYQLFLESWRAKTCSRCSKYFISDKPAQIYCSTECSGGKKRERALAWWNQTGAERRATHRQKRKAKRGRR